MLSQFIEFMMRFQRALLFAIGIWCVGGVFGWWFHPIRYQLSREDFRAWTAMLKEVDAQQIILNNLLVITVSLTGLFTAGSTAVLTLLINGFIAVLFFKDLEILELTWAVRYRLSYAVFEVCALWISSAVGLLGFSQVFNLFTKSRFLFLYKEIALIITAYLISIALTIIAGLLEAELIAMLSAQK